MFYRILLLLVLLPLVETTLLLMMGYYTRSVLVPLLFIVITGLVGSWLARRQGFAAYGRIQAELAAGRTPTEAMLDAAMIFLAGILMVLPGVLTDLVGISLLIPPVRTFYRRRAAAWLRQRYVGKGSLTSVSSGRGEVIDSYVVEKRSPDDISDQV